MQKEGAIEGVVWSVNRVIEDERGGESEKERRLHGDEMLFFCDCLLLPTEY